MAQVYTACAIKYLELDIFYGKPFSYNIRLNGENENRKIDYDVPQPTALLRSAKLNTL